MKAAPNTESPFVLSVSNLLGYDDEHNCIRLKNGYAAVIRVSGIDIVNYKAIDQEQAYLSFGIGLQKNHVPHKMVFVSDHVDYSEQIHFLRCRLKTQEHPYLRFLLERQISWLQAYESSQSDRCGYEIFFSENPIEASDAADQFAAQLRAGKNVAERCNREQCIRLYQILNKVVMNNEPFQEHDEQS